MSAEAAKTTDTSLLTVAIPRVLWWFRLWPLWKTFFEELGFRVVTNDPARPTPRRHDRASTIVEEACFPMQLLLDRTLDISDRADVLFVPRLISVDPRGIMCPRFTGVPDIVRMVLSRIGCQPVEQDRSSKGAANEMTGCQPILLAPVIDARLGRSAVRHAYLSMASELGKPARLARQAFRRALAVQEQFEAELESRLNALPTPNVFSPASVAESDFPQSRIQNRKSKMTSGPPALRSPRVALLGHPYATFDWEFSLRIVEKLRSLGVWVIPLESVAPKRIEAAVKKLDKNVYWTPGRDVLGAALSFFERGGADGVIYLSCFKCGVDGLLLNVVQWAARHQAQVPYLPLTLDGHDNEMGLMTRLEAFADIVRGRFEKQRIVRK